jgi:hypothetical protein
MFRSKVWRLSFLSGLVFGAVVIVWNSELRGWPVTHHIYPWLDVGHVSGLFLLAFLASVVVYWIIEWIGRGE